MTERKPLRMTTSKAGIELIKLNEGVRKFVYRDVAGLPTIGCGHLLNKSELSSGKILIAGRPVKYALGLTSIEIDALLALDLYSAETNINYTVTVPLTQNQFDALISFSFNTGNGAFNRSQLLKLLNARHYDLVPPQMKRWIYAGGDQVPGLVKRREREAAMWKDGK